MRIALQRGSTRRVIWLEWTRTGESELHVSNRQDQPPMLRQRFRSAVEARASADKWRDEMLREGWTEVECD